MLLKELGAGKSRDWFISPKIMKANREIKALIRAFFDDEACFNDGRIRLGRNRKLNSGDEMQRVYLLATLRLKDYYPDTSVF